MHKMIKIAMVPLAALLLVLGGCGGEDPHTGTWKLDKTAFEAQMREMMAAQMPPGVTEVPDAAKEMMEQAITNMVENSQMTLTLNADGTFVADGTFSGEEPEHEEGTWTQADGVITMNIEGDDPANASLRDGALYVTMPDPGGNSMEMKFTRSP